MKRHDELRRQALKAMQDAGVLMQHGHFDYGNGFHGRVYLNTGKTFEHCAALVRSAGGSVLATVEICDRMEAVADIGVPNYALVEYPAPENFPVGACPMCAAGEPITRF